MESQKIYLAGNSGNGSPNDALWASMMNNNGFGGNNAWWLLFLLFFARGGYGFGGDGIQSQLANDKANDWVMSALQGNRSAIDNIASILNSDFNAVQSTLNQIAAQIQNVAAKTELSSAPYCNNFAFGAYGNPYGPFPGGGFFG